MHTYAIAMRWADLDSLNHVNNVVYLDYAAESRAAMVDEGLLDEAAPVVGVSVKYQRPLPLGRTPVTVASSLDGPTLTQEICLDAGGERTVFAEVVTRFGEHEIADPHHDAQVLPAVLRRGDVDASGHVTPAKVVELFQEARVLSVATRLNAFRPGGFVVGTSDVTLHAPIRWRSEPCVAGVRIGRVGRASFEIVAQLRDETAVLASSRTILVGFDPHSQRSRPFSDAERAQLDAFRNSP